ncbi:Bacterial SH3 domain protein [Roseivivax sp. THAF40]|uniref:SH3 domain-containing protein n=1 Tax=unclassified Roseivivax TaxID=2639302 RepID=UPI001268CA89|nr:MULTISPECIES: SH3 domain-containing protein [unclassified Roseivivax]QFS83127.1 Bacterial SH3 domain protein [Roseivivax sp. THAF197b]QFT46871.1 Bacterial SH3 domain protein [Roseivivax sp. THAF40]
MTCKTRTLTCILAVPAMVGAMASAAFADTPLEVAPAIPASVTESAEPWPVYEGPGIDNDIVARVATDAVVEVSGCLEADPWCAVSGPKFSGWVSQAAIDTGDVTPPAIDVDWENPLLILVDEEVVPEDAVKTE